MAERAIIIHKHDMSNVINTKVLGRNLILPNLDQIIRYTLFYRKPEGEEVDDLLDLFSCYTHPVNAFYVELNGIYSRLDQSLSGTKQTDIMDNIVGHMISYGGGAYDAGMQESRLSPPIIPHPCPPEKAHEETYEMWKKTVENYNKFLKELTKE